MLLIGPSMTAPTALTTSARRDGRTGASEQYPVDRAGGSGDDGTALYQAGDRRVQVVSFT